MILIYSLGKGAGSYEEELVKLSLVGNIIT
jgi:hypothetical protein